MTEACRVYCSSGLPAGKLYLLLYRPGYYRRLRSLVFPSEAVPPSINTVIPKETGSNLRTLPYGSSYLLEPTCLGTKWFATTPPLLMAAVRFVQSAPVSAIYIFPDASISISSRRMNMVAPSLLSYITRIVKRIPVHRHCKPVCPNFLPVYMQRAVLFHNFQKYLQQI